MKNVVLCAIYLYLCVNLVILDKVNLYMNYLVILMQGYTKGYRGIQGIQRYTIQEDTREYIGIQGIQGYIGGYRGYKGILGDTRVYRGIKGIQRMQKGIQNTDDTEETRAYRVSAVNTWVCSWLQWIQEYTENRGDTMGYNRIQGDTGGTGGTIR